MRLLQAEALLEAGDLPAAETAAERGCRSGRRQRSGRIGRRRVPLIATELHTRVVAARLELARGRRSSGLAHIRRGLDDLAAYQARFGSQDLQSASAVHGRELTRLGLRTALQTRLAGGDPAVAGTIPGGEHPVGRGPAVGGRCAGPGAEQAADGLLPARMALLAGAAGSRTWRTRSTSCGAGCGPGPGALAAPAR